MVQHHPDTQRFVLETFLMDSDLLIDNEGHICKECVVIQMMVHLRVTESVARPKNSDRVVC